MKIWIECRDRKDYPTRYYIWSGTAPKWDDHYGIWMKRTIIGKYICNDWIDFLFGGQSFEYPRPGELAELEVNHLETWEVR